MSMDRVFMVNEYPSQGAAFVAAHDYARTLRDPVIAPITAWPDGSAISGYHVTDDDPELQPCGCPFDGPELHQSGCEHAATTPRCRAPWGHCDGCGHGIAECPYRPVCPGCGSRDHDQSQCPVGTTLEG